jgi:hypothetical protein
VIQLQPVCFTWGCGRPRESRGYCNRCRKQLYREEDVQPWDPAVFSERKKCPDCHNRFIAVKGKCRRCYTRGVRDNSEYKKKRAAYDREYGSRADVRHSRNLRRRGRRLAANGVTKHSFVLVS